MGFEQLRERGLFGVSNAFSSSAHLRPGGGRGGGTGTVCVCVCARARDQLEALHVPFDVSQCSLPGLTFRSDLLRMGLVGTRGSGWKPRNVDTQCETRQHGLWFRLVFWPSFTPRLFVVKPLIHRYDE